MRLARPVYETLPATYGVIGLAAFYTFYIDPGELRGRIAFGIGMFAIIAAVTLTLHRQDYRAARREYSGGTFEL